MYYFQLALFILFACALRTVDADQPLWKFEGKALVSVSDADMLASAYVDGKLGPLEGTDQLSVIDLQTQPSAYSATEIPVSNSVAGPPAVLAITPDGKYAFVIETFSSRPRKSTNETFADLKAGNLLSVVDLQNLKRPIVISQHQLDLRPDSISINHDGSLIAISYHPASAKEQSPLEILRFKKGKVGERYRPVIPGWNATDRLISVEFHPSKNILALINQTAATVKLVNILDNLELESWGNTVSVGKSPFIARFSRNAKHLLVNNLYWGSDVSGTWNEAPRGTIVNISLEHFEKNGSPVHSLTSQVMVGPSPEGFALSPDGRYVVTANMERSWLPYDDPRQNWFSSLSLISRDPDSGEMTLLHTTPYDGILPEAVVFDASSSNIAVTTYDHYDPKIYGGSIDFFRIAHDPLDKSRKMIVPTRWSVPVTRGPHSMLLVE